jgi:hypothetical protein
MQGAQLMEDNQRLKQVSGREFPFFFFLFFGFPTFSIDGKCQFQQMENQLMIKTHVTEQGQSSVPITNICSSADPPQHQDNDDTSLKLG